MSADMSARAPGQKEMKKMVQCWGRQKEIKQMVQCCGRQKEIKQMVQCLWKAEGN